MIFRFDLQDFMQVNSNIAGTVTGRAGKTCRTREIADRGTKD
jgi:hypothetical protein